MTGLARSLLQGGFALYARSEHGASAAEYALLLAIVAGCAIVALRHLGDHIGLALNNVSTALR